MTIKEKESLILKGYPTDLVEKWGNYILLWPSKEKISELAKKNGYTAIRFIGPHSVVNVGYMKKRMNVIYNEKNMITKVNEG